MKVLLTIEEYKERAINLVMEVAKETLNPNAADIFKMDFIQLYAEKCVTDNVMYYDICNQMYIRTFEYDRNGRKITFDVTKEIDDKEAKEFNSQPLVKKYNDEAKKYWRRIHEITGYDKDGYYDKHSRVFNITYTLINIFNEVDHNAAYHIANEAFKRLYGYEYEVDRDFKLE